VRTLINRRAVLVLAKCKTNKSEYDQDGSRSPMRILHVSKLSDHFRASAQPANVAGLDLSLTR
jgi:hypothetical protein